MRPDPPQPGRTHQTFIGLFAVLSTLAACPGSCLLYAVLPSSTSRWLGAVLPVAFVVLLLLTLLDMRRQTSRKRDGQCENCGYDLRATPDRCPECGRIPAPNRS